MTRDYFRNTIVISLLGHITLFGLFSFSFGRMIFKSEYAPLVFWGQILPGTDLNICRNNIRHKNHIFNRNPDTSVLDNVDSGVFSATVYDLKPAVPIAINKEKSLFLRAAASELYVPPKKESVIMFHPLLPYQLQLYFKDRQSVHIELMFNIIPGKEKNSIVIKRKVSSGNLEADLLSLRYIGHYLFIQQARFQPGNWQTVKIDLSLQK